MVQLIALNATEELLQIEAYPTEFGLQYDGIHNGSSHTAPHLFAARNSESRCLL